MLKFCEANKLECLSMAHFQDSIIFASRAEANLSVAQYGAPLYEKDPGLT
jgi:hypothetical protein